MNIHEQFKVFLPAPPPKEGLRGLSITPDSAPEPEPATRVLLHTVTSSRYGRSDVDDLGPILRVTGLGQGAPGCGDPQDSQEPSRKGLA